MTTQAQTKNFNIKTDPRLACSCCNQYLVKQWALDKLQLIRDDAARPLKINSAYRCKNHPAEKRKAKPGSHNAGVAFDISVNNAAERHQLIKLAIKHGASGIGVAKTFIHIDWRIGTGKAWTY